MVDFKEIYTTYSPQVYRVCMGYVNDHDRAKDLMQETFISIWKNQATFKHKSKISTWIFRIATNNCLRELEKSKRVMKAELPVNLPDILEESKESQLTFLYNCIAQLEETDRIIISLVLEDLPQAEIAEIVGISNANIRVKIHRIKDKLSIKFQKYGQFE